MPGLDRMTDRLPRSCARSFSVHATISKCGKEGLTRASERSDTPGARPHLAGTQPPGGASTQALPLLFGTQPSLAQPDTRRVSDRDGERRPSKPGKGKMSECGKGARTSVAMPTFVAEPSQPRIFSSFVKWQSFARRPPVSARKGVEVRPGVREKRSRGARGGKNLFSCTDGRVDAVTLVLKARSLETDKESDIICMSIGRSARKKAIRRIFEELA